MSFLETGIGWLAPPQCVGCGDEGSPLCKNCILSTIVPFGERCWQCNALSPRSRACVRCRRLGGPSSVWIVTNYEALAQEVVQAYKFGHQRVVAAPLSRLMSATFSHFNQGLDYSALNYLVIPVPTATSRSRQRGFDHAGLLAKSVARHLVMQQANCVGRLGQSRQVGAPRSQRLAQPDGNYFIRRPRQVQGRNILLVDDVVTTGATLRVVTKILKNAGANQVDALIFAKRL